MLNWPKDKIFVKDYGFLPLAKNIENIGKNISKNLGSKKSQKHLYDAN